MTGTRRVVAGLVLAVLVMTSGCAFLGGDSTVTAEQATESEQALSDTGYSEASIEQRNITRTFTVADTTRNVTVGNWLAEYERQVDLGPVGSGELARFSLFATPQVEVAGESLNAVGSMSNAELAKMLQDEYGTIENVQLEGNRTERMLGEETTVSKFSADARTSTGESVDVYLHVAKVAHGDDFVIAIAIYPQDLNDEQSKVNRLLEGVEHETG
jgi:hypothetical protein